MTTLEAVYNEINKVKGFLQSITDIVNGHLNDFLVLQLWEKLPNLLKKDLLVNKENCFIFNSHEQTDELGWSFQSSDFSSYICMAIQCSLTHISKNIGKEKISYTQGLDCSSLPKEAFNMMSDKKKHEIINLVNIITSLCYEEGEPHILDLGSGLGYLSTFLSEFCGFHVLAVDASEHHITRMLKRSNQLKKLKDTWVKKGLHTLPSNGSLHGISEFVKPDCDIKGLTKNSGNNLHGVNSVAITGLHICGNLSSLSCELYARNNCARVLVNVGCCYHLIQEKFEKNDDFMDQERPLDGRYDSYHSDPLHPHMHENSEHGFPLSNILKKQEYSLGKTARMLANQKPIVITEELKTSTKLFWRALLQKVVIDRLGKWPDKVQVGRKIKADNFYNFCNAALANIDAGFTLTEDEASSYENGYPLLKEFHVYNILRSHAAPAVEALLVLDKLAYLLEQGFENSHIVEAFEDSISPRRWCVISSKSKKVT